MDIIIGAIASFFGLFLENTSFVNGLPTAFMKPLSGSGARGLMLESFQHFGVDSFIGKLTSTLQGATDTTFYIIAVYFGSVSIRKTRYAITAGLIADFAGIVSAIFIAYLFFGNTVNKISNEQLTNKFANAVYANNLIEIVPHMNSSIYLIDQQMDTLATNTIEFVAAFNSLENYKLKWSKQLSEKEYLLKFQNEKESKSYKLEFKNGEIQKAEYLGFFKYD